MRVAMALVVAGLVCSMSVEAEARARGGGFFKGGSSSSHVPTPQAKSSPSVGVGVVVPVGTSRPERTYMRQQQSQPRPYLLPLPPRSVEDGDQPRFHSASADVEPKPVGEKRPWCADGQIVGRGAGFCDLGLSAEKAGAPALLALSN